MMKKSSKQNRILALAASAAMLVLLLTAGVFAYATPATYVSLDVNPSLVFEVNVFDRVIGLEAMNEDAEAVLAGLEWKNKDVEDVLTMAVQKIEQEGYFDKGGDILIAAAGKKDAHTADLLANLKERVEALDLEDVSIQTDAVGEEMVAAAKEFGLTPGKYNLITNLLGKDVEEYAELSVKDLMALFTETKGVLGKETAESAKQNNGVGTLPSQAEAGQQTAEQRASEASQKASEASARASEPPITETLPANNNQPPVETPKSSEAEIPQPTSTIPTATSVEIPVVPTNPTEPTVPTTSTGRP